MSGDWKRLHRVREVCSGSLENHWVTRSSHKTKAEYSKEVHQFNHPGGAVKPPGLV
jgi:hypothetical protein